MPEFIDKISERVNINPCSDPVTAVSSISYRIEHMLTNGATEKQIKENIAQAIVNNEFPSNLEYISSFYDELGTCGCAFLDTYEQIVVVGFSGTNLTASGTKDLQTDAQIFMGYMDSESDKKWEDQLIPIHMKSALDFYTQIKSDTKHQIILTGHSLGGNVAALVALYCNVPDVVTYNGAPLYLLKSEGSALIDTIDKLASQYKGTIIRLVSDKDFLNPLSIMLGGTYLGQLYLISYNIPHGIGGFLGNKAQSDIRKILIYESEKVSKAKKSRLNEVEVKMVLKLQETQLGELASSEQDEATTLATTKEDKYPSPDDINHALELTTTFVKKMSDLSNNSMLGNMNDSELSLAKQMMSQAENKVNDNIAKMKDEYLTDERKEMIDAPTKKLDALQDSMNSYKESITSFFTKKESETK